MKGLMRVCGGVGDFRMRTTRRHRQLKTVPPTCCGVIGWVRGDDIDDVFRVESKLPGLEFPQKL